MIYGKDNFDGKSFKLILDGKNFEPRESLYFELGYARAVIKGKYKYYAVRYLEYVTSWTDEDRAEWLDAYNHGWEYRKMPIVNCDPSKPFSHLEIVTGGGEAENESYKKLAGYFNADQLYDLEEDPHELNSLVNDPDYQELMKKMKTELQKYIDDLPGNFDS